MIRSLESVFEELFSGRWIQLPLKFLQITKSTDEALLLAYLLNQCRWRGKYTQETGGWFWRTREQILRDLGINYQQQKRLLRRLKSCGYLEVVVRKRPQDKGKTTPGVRHYRIHTKAIIKAWRGSPGTLLRRPPKTRGPGSPKTPSSI